MYMIVFKVFYFDYSDRGIAQVQHYRLQYPLYEAATEKDLDIMACNTHCMKQRRK